MVIKDTECGYSLAEHDSGILCVVFSGDWCLSREGCLKDVAMLAEKLSANKYSRLTFDTAQLSAWDSVLVTFALQCRQLCTQHALSFDQDKLPRGVGKLLDLVKAAPEEDKVESTAPQTSLVYQLGEKSIAISDRLVDAVRFIGESVVAFFRLMRGKAHFRWKDCFLVIQQAGAESLPIVTLISFLIGFIMAYVGAIQLVQFGANVYVANLVGLAMVREMGAMMVAVILSGRIGAAFAAYLGSMIVREEVDSLKTLGIPPIEFLVLPRLIALVLMVPLLTVYSNFIGILGGFFIGTNVLGITMEQYINQTQGAIDFGDISVGLIKSTVFGFIIAISGCLRGLQTGHSSSAVGLSATSAVVTSITWIIITDAIFTVIFNIFGI